MFKNYLSANNAVSSYGIIAIIIFFSVFCFVLAYVIFMRKDLVKEMEQAPLHDSLTQENNSTSSKTPL